MKQSAVSDHRLQCDYIIIFDDFDVLASDTNNFRQQAWQERKRWMCGHHSSSSIQGKWLAIDDQKI